MQTFKQTARTVLCFILAFTVLSTAVMECFFRSELHVYQDNRERKALAGTLDTLYVGASYAKRGLIPSIIDETLGTSSYNLAHSDMSMQGRYEMLLHELPRNPIRRVYLELSMDSLSLEPYVRTMEGDLYIIPRLENPLDRVRYAVTSFAFLTYGWLYYQLMIRGFDDIKMLAMGQYTTVNKYQMRGYVPFQDQEEYVPVTKSPVKVYHRRARPDVRYPKNVRYLEKIIELCREYDAELVFLSIPMSEYSISKFSNLQDIHDYYQEVADANGITYFDFNLWTEKADLISDSMYQNATHLGNDGAVIFSEHFGEIMAKYDSGEDVSGYFYPGYDALCHDRGYDVKAAK